MQAHPSRWSCSQTDPVRRATLRMKRSRTCKNVHRRTSQGDPSVIYVFIFIASFSAGLGTKRMTQELISFAHCRTWTGNPEKGVDFKSTVFTNFTKRAYGIGYWILDPMRRVLSKPKRASENLREFKPWNRVGSRSKVAPKQDHEMSSKESKKSEKTCSKGYPLNALFWACFTGEKKPKTNKNMYILHFRIFRK